MSSVNILSRLGSRFNSTVSVGEHPDFLTRDIGGQFRKNQPYISGYFQVMFGLPDELFGGAADAATASKWLHSTCESFTPHTQMLNHVEVMGQGQIGSSFPSSVTTTREFTLAFREYQNLPILNIIKRWASVFDPFTGVSPLQGNKFIPMNYKGWVAVLQTKPVKSKDESLTIDDVEESYIYHGVTPTNIPLDALNSDITANDVSQLSITFKFDNSPLTSAEPGVTDKLLALFNGLKYLGAGSTYDKYFNEGKTITTWGPSGQGGSISVGGVSIP